MKIIIPILIFIFFIFVDFYALKSIKTTFELSFFKTNIFKYIYWGVSLSILLVLIYGLFSMSKSTNPSSFNILYVFMTLLVLFYIPKLNIVIFHLTEDLISLFLNRYSIITKVGVGISTIIFLLIIHGITINKYNYKLNTQELYFKNLPSEFDGYKIIQISDIHLGSMMGNTAGIEQAVSIINNENPDLILFTGDLVNNTANEVDGFEEAFKKLKSKNGIYSILGNHDYGDYVPWKTKIDKEENLKQLISKHKDLNFNLLLNKNIRINKDTSNIVIAGVENWGKPPFPQFGDLNKALKNTTKNDFIILLSHDPSHWRAQVLDSTNVTLTLSGHTHAMQAGFEIGNFQWSPVSLKYKEWGGLYSKANQYLYVNRGLGFIGLLGRIGIRPEITEIILKKTPN